MRKKSKTIWIVIIISIICAGVYIYFLNTYSRNSLVTQFSNKEITNSQDIFNLIKSRDVSALSAVLDGILMDKEYKDIFLKRDRTALFNYSQDLFKNIRNDYEITHFYFHLPDGTNFVRIHDETKYNDKINRSTFKQAVDSNKIGAGIELGQTAFALRVVKPYYDNDKLIGYIELGQEMDHFLKILKANTNSNYSIFVNKNAVNKENWKSVRLANGWGDDWDSYEKLVEMNTTSDNIQDRVVVSDCLNEYNAQKVFSFQGDDKISIGEYGQGMFCGGFDLLDAANNKIGVVLISFDISSDLLVIDSFIHKEVMFIVILLIFILCILYFVTNIKSKEQKKYKYLFEGSDDAILTLTPPDWRFSDGNSAALKMFGFKDIKQLEVTDPIKLSPEFQPNKKTSTSYSKEMIEEALKKGTNSFDWVHKRVNGEDFFANVLLTKIDLGHDTVLQAIIHDITKQKKTTELIEKSSEEMKKALIEADRLNKVMVGRELEMVRLKKELSDIKNKHEDKN